MLFVTHSGAGPKSTAVETFGELKAAVAAGSPSIDVTKSIIFTSTVVISSSAAATRTTVAISSSVSAMLSGGGNVQLFRVHNGSRLVLSSLTLQNSSTPMQNGSTSANMSAACADDLASCAGGAIFVDGADSVVEIRATLARANRAVFGGAIGVGKGALVISNGCRFENNTASRAGGAISLQRSDDRSRMHKCSFQDNVAFEGGAIDVESAHLTGTKCSWTRNAAQGSGGAVRLKSNASLTVSSSTFGSNTAREHGGALWARYSRFAMTQSVLTANRAHKSAGAIFAWTDSKAEIAESLLHDNSAKFAGALRVDGTAHITDSKFASNKAKYAAAAGVNKNGLLTAQSVRFEGNTASNSGSAIYVYKGRLRVQSSIFSRNRNSAKTSKFRRNSVADKHSQDQSPLFNKDGTVRCYHGCPADTPDNVMGCAPIDCFDCKCYSCDCESTVTSSSTTVAHEKIAKTDVQTEVKLIWSETLGVIICASVFAAIGCLYFFFDLARQVTRRFRLRSRSTSLASSLLRLCAVRKHHRCLVVFTYMGIVAAPFLAAIMLVRKRHSVHAAAPHIVSGSPDYLMRMATSSSFLLAEDAKPWWWDFLIFNITREGVLRSVPTELWPADVHIHHCDDDMLRVLGLTREFTAKAAPHFKSSMTAKGGPAFMRGIRGDPVHCMAKPLMFPGCQEGFYGRGSVAKPCPHGFFCPQAAICYIACPPGSWCGEWMLDEEKGACVVNGLSRVGAKYGTDPAVEMIHSASFDSSDNSAKIEFDTEALRMMPDLPTVSSDSFSDSSTWALHDTARPENGVTVHVDVANGTALCPGTKSLRLCPGGAYCESASHLKDCPAGYFCPSGSILPVRCGFFENCRGTGNAHPGRTTFAFVATFAVLSIACGCRWALATYHLSAMKARAARMKHVGARTARRELEFTIQLKSYSLSLTISTASTRLRVVDELSVRFEPGRVAAILGPSGAGKTSVMDLLAGRVSTGRITGSLLINGKQDTVHSYSAWVGAASGRYHVPRAHRPRDIRSLCLVATPTGDEARHGRDDC